MEGGIPDDPNQKIVCHVTFQGDTDVLRAGDQAWVLRRGNRMAQKGRTVIGEMAQLFADCSGNEALTLRLDTRQRACVATLGNRTMTLPVNKAHEYAVMLDDATETYRDWWLVRQVVNLRAPSFMTELTLQARQCLTELENLAPTNVAVTE